MKHLNTIILAGSLATGLASVAAEIDWSKLPPASKQENVTFEKDIAPIMKESCVRCHGAERPRANLRLDTLEGVLQGTKMGPILKAGNSEHSLLVKSVSQLDPETAMPPKPRARRSIPQGTNAPAMRQREGGPEGEREGQPPRRERREEGVAGGEGERPQGTNAPGQRPRNFGPPAKPLTAEQVGLVRAWIDQGAK